MLTPEQIRSLRIVPDEDDDRKGFFAIEYQEEYREGQMCWNCLATLMEEWEAEQIVQALQAMEILQRRKWSICRHKEGWYIANIDKLDQEQTADFSSRFYYQESHDLIAMILAAEKWWVENVEKGKTP